MWRAKKIKIHKQIRQNFLTVNTFKGVTKPVSVAAFFTSRACLLFWEVMRISHIELKFVA